MDSENSIQLLKDFIIPRTASSWVQVKKENIPDLDESSFGHGTSIYAKEILDCIQMSKGSPRYIQMGVFQSPASSTHKVYYVHINNDIRHTMTRILQNYSFQVICKVKYSAETDITTYDRRIDVSELGSVAHLHQAVFDSFGLSQESDVTTNIFIRWAERNMSKIKLATDSFLHSLFGKESSKDLTIVAGDGTEVGCHRIVFEAHSDVLTAMLSPENGLSESKTGRVELKENSGEGIRLFIRYLYGKGLSTNDIDCDITIELFQLSHKYELKELEDHLSKFLLLKGSDWFHQPDPLLELYFHIKNMDEFKDLRDHALVNLLGLSLEVRKCERFKELNRTDPTAAAELLFKLLDLATK